MDAGRSRFVTVLAAVSLCTVIGVAAWAVFTPAEEIAFPAEPPYVAAEFVYVTPSGTKYHRSGCSATAGSARLECIKPEAAAERGYGPCMICVP